MCNIFDMGSSVWVVMEGDSGVYRHEAKMKTIRGILIVFLHFQLTLALSYHNGDEVMGLEVL